MVSGDAGGLFGNDKGGEQGSRKVEIAASARHLLAMTNGGTEWKGDPAVLQRGLEEVGCRLVTCEIWMTCC